MSNVYTNIKDIFLNEEASEFIALTNSVECEQKILNTIKKPLKMILFYGKPGSGKTFLLKKIANNTKFKKQIILFTHPFFNEKEFILALCSKIYGKFINEVDNFENFMYYYTHNFTYKDEILSHQKIIILDEAQLYPDELVEKIRLMSDTRYFKFLFTIHKIDDEELLVKEHFKSRIWESIELKNADINEIRLYILKKLKGKNFFFNEDDFCLIYDLSKANLRTLNKLMYKFFEIFESYEVFAPSRILEPDINKKVIYMAAIALGIINA